MSIDRPKVAQLDALFTTVAKIHRAEARLATLKEQVAREARALADIADKALRIQAGFYAYWFAPEVPAADIAFGATGRTHPAKLMKLAGAVSVGIQCERCQEELPIRSRTQMKEVLDRARRENPLPDTYRFLCIGCQNRLDEEHLMEGLAECERQDVRQRVLDAMPYAEYLRTEEFAAARDLHLWWLAEHVHALECETCNSAKTLGLYHKPLHGEGGRGDLILLCEVCRDALMSAGKLGETPGDANLITEELAEAVLEGLRAELSY